MKLVLKLHVLTIGSGLLKPTNFRKPPGFAVIQRDLDPDDLFAPPGISVSLHRVRIVLPNRDHFIVPRPGNGTVDVEIINDVVRLEPPT